MKSRKDPKISISLNEIKTTFSLTQESGLEPWAKYIHYEAGLPLQPITLGIIVPFLEST